jgi:uncharacterized protein (DUF2267 family)
MALNFNQFAMDANKFLDEYSNKLNLSEDKDKAARILSSILHALREVISMEESLQLIAQLPMFLKAVYVNGWTNKRKRKTKNMVDFIDLMREFNGKTSVNDLESDQVAEEYIDQTFIMLRQYVSPGELHDLRSSLPKDLKNMIHTGIMF